MLWSAVRIRTSLFVAQAVLVAFTLVYAHVPANAAQALLLQLRQVALSGESPNGLPTSGTFSDFASAPVIDNQGNVAFIAALGPSPAAQSVWTESDGGLRLVARSGDSAPTTGATFAQFSDLVTADGGITVFKALLAGSVIGADNRDSIWCDRSGALTLIAQAGRPAPDPTGDLQFSHFETPIVANRNGESAFFARTRDKEDDAFQSSGIWLAGASHIDLAANEGFPAVDGQPNIVFLPQSFEQPFSNDPVISPTGQTIFRGFLAGPGVTESNLNGLWSYRPFAGLELLMRAGDHVVGSHGAVFLSFPGTPTINAAGDTAFLAFTEAEHEHGLLARIASTGGSEEHHIHLGLWLRRSSGELSQIFAIGDPAPGLHGDVHFVDTFNPVMNATGGVAFLAAVDGDGVDGSNEIGLWSNAMAADGQLRLVARQGDEAPGREPGFVFGVFLEPSLNAAGQTAFMASGYRQLDGTIVDSAFGVWGQDRAGELRLVASVGQLLQIGPGDYREIAALMFAFATGGEDGKQRGLNDAGQVVLRATFTDGSSGIFVSNALAVPEPPVAALVLGAAICLLMTRPAS